MNLLEMLIAAMILLPAFAAATWIWFCMSQIEEDLDAFRVIDGVPSTFGPQAKGRIERT